MKAELHSFHGPDLCSMGAIRLRWGCSGGAVQLLSSLRGLSDDWQAEVAAHKAGSTVPCAAPSADHADVSRSSEAESLSPRTGHVLQPKVHVVVPPQQRRDAEEPLKRLRFKATPRQAETQERVSRLEQENARLRALLLESELRSRATAASPGAVSGQLGECQDELQGAFAHCRLPGHQLQEAEEGPRCCSAVGAASPGEHPARSRMHRAEEAVLDLLGPPRASPP